MSEISTEDLEQMLLRAAKVGAEAGARAAMERMEEAEKQRRKSRHDSRIHNTKLLLQKYRVLDAQSKHAVFSADQLDEKHETALDILDAMMRTNHQEEIVESIQKNTIRTALIVEHVRKMVDVYKVLCDMSDRMEDRRYYQIIYGLYIAPQRLSVRVLAERYNVSESAIYKGAEAATDTLSCLIFGIDGTKLK